MLGLIQCKANPDPDTNLRRTLDKISEAATLGAQIICLQELFRTVYFPQDESASYFKLAEAIPGRTTEALRQVARKKKIVIVGSLFEKRTEGVYHNTAVVIDADGSIQGLYRKMHIPDDPCFYEKFYFTPGDLGFKTFQTKYAKIGVLICWDQWFPEGARLTALQGAQILFYPTAIGTHSKEFNLFKVQHSAWETIQRSHAIANGVYVAAVNRVGHEGELKFWGASFVSDPFGEIIHRGDHEKEENIIVSCDLNKIEETRHGWPFLRDRRIDAYQDITRRYLQS